jgi:hypothetical protein
LHFIEARAGSQPQNALAPPYGRAGGWGFLTMLRYYIADDEAIILKMDDACAEYAGIQMVDMWTIATDPQKHVSSFTTKQSRMNADGTYTYVIAARDPGVSNWVETAGIRQGWLILRWQGVPPEQATNEGLFREFRIVKTSEIAALVPAEARGITSAGRQKEHQDRFDSWRLRIATGE